MKYFAITSIASIVVIGLFALGGEANSQQSAPDFDPIQVARGAQSWAQECSRCHNLRAPSELTDEECDIQAFLKNANN